jgi:hypothetical protein
MGHPAEGWPTRLLAEKNDWSVMKKSVVILFEIAMLLGIAGAAFMVPRNTPLLTFLIISCAVFLLGNVLLFNRVKRKDTGENSSDPQRKPRLYIAFIPLVAYLLWYFIFK